MKNCIILIAGLLLFGTACGEPTDSTSVSGVSRASVEVRKGTDGLTSEQRNVKQRVVEDNKPGAIKHLYVISAYSGQVLIYSTVRGKVTSSSKRLTPATVTGWNTGANVHNPASAAGYFTNELIQDDGTFGSSVEYVYWWDSKDVYHQHYVVGGQILHVASAPMAVKSVVINMESAADGPEQGK